MSLNPPPDVIVIPGFNSEGHYIEKLCPYFKRAGYRCNPFIYGKDAWTTLGNVIANRFRLKTVANQLVSKIHLLRKPVILVGHSNGAALAYLTQKECMNVVGVITFNGALNSGSEFRQDKPGVPGCWVINCYHEGDWVLNLGKWRPGHLWGDWGKRPQRQNNVWNYDLGQKVNGFNPHSLFLEKLDDIIPCVFSMMYQITETA